MRIKIKGRIKLKEINKITEIIYKYLNEYSIEQTRDINFYFTPLDPNTKKRVSLTFSEIGEEIEGWTFEDPNKKVAKKKPNIIHIDFDK